MEIHEIKSGLHIEDVLSHYGVKINNNKHCLCPFHEDKTPSMQVYPETGTVFCFSGNCELNGKAIDQIDFIMHKEQLSKHEAIEKAKALCVPQVKNTHGLSRQGILLKLFKEAEASLQRSQKALDYCKSRNLPTKGIGFLGDRFYHKWNKNLITSAIKLGVIKEQGPVPIKSGNGQLTSAFRNTIIFPLRDRQGLPVSLYGRNISPESKVSHVYPKGKHEGLYPSYPNPKTRHLIITESIIDAQVTRTDRA